MAKYTYGFRISSGTSKEEATREAVAKARAAEGNPEPFHYTSEVLETDAHKENDEFCIVIRTPEGVEVVGESL